jgi:outer membrane protein assembly factor BamE (lipoprotein component of BamABCDE complex)
MMRASLWLRHAPRSTVTIGFSSRALRHIAWIVCLLVGGCVYRLDIQQGNLLKEDAVDQVTIGMSRSAVQFLLGTPMIADAFHQDRWDYAYYLRHGHSRELEKRWIIVYFADDRVTDIERNLTLNPSTRR